MMVEAVGTLILEGVGLGVAAAGFTFGATAISLATVVGGAAVLAGTIGLQMLLRPAAPGSAGAADVTQPLPTPDSGHQALRQAIPSRITGYGTQVRIAGYYVLFEESGGISYDVIALHHGRITSIDGYYLHDDVVTVDPVTGYVAGLGDSRYLGNVVRIRTRLGNVPEDAYNEISSALPTIWGGSPAATHRGDGLASLSMICLGTATSELFFTTYPRGKPEPSVIASLTKILDIRTNVTQVSNNPVLQLIDFLTNTDYGMGLDYATLITPVLSPLATEASLCENAINLKAGGAEPRYESRGTFPLDSDPASVVNTILDTCDGWISENGDGTLALKVGVYRDPSITILDKHIRGFSLQKGTPDEELVNELTIDYTSPSADYKTVPGQPWRDETNISEIGKVRSQQFSLPWVYSHSQARRLAKRRMTQLNAPLQGTLTTTLFGLRAMGERWIRIDAPLVLADFTSLIVEVRAVTIDLANAQVVFKFLAVNPNTVDAWDPTTEEGSPPVIPSKLVFPPAPVPANVAAQPISASEPNPHDSSTFFIMFDDPGRSDLTFECAWRVFGGSPDIPFNIDPRVSPIFQTSFGRWSARGGFGITTAATYEVKVRTFAPAGPGSAYSSTTTVFVSGGA